MAPGNKETRKRMSAAERQKRRRERLRRENVYDDYKARNAAYSRKYRAKQRRNIAAADLSKKNELLEEKRRKDRLRKQKSRNKVVERLTPTNQRSP